MVTKFGKAMWFCILQALKYVDYPPPDRKHNCNFPIPCLKLYFICSSVYILKISTTWKITLRNFVHVPINRRIFLSSFTITLFLSWYIVLLLYIFITRYIDQFVFGASSFLVLIKVWEVSRHLCEDAKKDWQFCVGDWDKKS